MYQAAKYLRNPWVIIGILAVVVLILWRMRGPLVSYFRPAALPNAGSVGIDLSGTEATMVRSLTQRLWTDIDRWNNPWWAKRDMETWTQLQEQDDRLFVAVYNDFGNMYYGMAGKTLKQYLREENFSLTASILTPWGMWTGSQLKAAILTRMDNLNLQ
jgi:hypothetical protein